MDSQSARAALDAADQSDHYLASRAQWPWWRHAIAGGLQAGFVMCWGLPALVAGIGIALAVSSIFLIMRSDRKRHGFFVSGYSSTKAMPAVILSITMVFGAFILLWRSVPMNTWDPLVPAASIVVFVGVTMCSLWWERLYQAELRQGVK